MSWGSDPLTEVAGPAEPIAFDERGDLVDRFPASPGLSGTSELGSRPATPARPKTFAFFFF